MNNTVIARLVIIAAALLLSQSNRIATLVEGVSESKPTETQIDESLLLRELCRNMSTTLSENERINTSNRLSRAWFDAWAFTAPHSEEAETDFSFVWLDVVNLLELGDTSIDLDQSARDQAAKVFLNHSLALTP